jgi:hypothetical protein
MSPCGFVEVAVTEREPHDLGRCSHLHCMGSLRGNNIGAAGARDLGAALQARGTLARRCRSTRR